jgi:outer membrane usher protein FimD/PapC
MSSSAFITAAAADAPTIGQDEEHKRQKEDQAPNDATASIFILHISLGQVTNADGRTSYNSHIDRRTCYSMGSYQYVLAEEHLLVSVHMRRDNNGNAGTACGTGTTDVTRRRGKR